MTVFWVILAINCHGSVCSQERYGNAQYKDAASCEKAVEPLKKECPHGGFKCDWYKS